MTDEQIEHLKSLASLLDSEQKERATLAVVLLELVEMRATLETLLAVQNILIATQTHPPDQSVVELMSPETASLSDEYLQNGMSRLVERLKAAFAVSQSSARE